MTQTERQTAIQTERQAADGRQADTKEGPHSSIPRTSTTTVQCVMHNKDTLYIIYNCSRTYVEMNTNRHTQTLTVTQSQYSHYIKMNTREPLICIMNTNGGRLADPLTWSARGHLAILTKLLPSS